MKPVADRIIKYVLILLTISIALCFTTLLFAFWPNTPHEYSFPGGHKFALAILDDTDEATLSNVMPVYRYLAEKNVISTKTVWALSSLESEHGYTQGDTLSDINYQFFIKKLQRQGFEIASHGSRGASTTRKINQQALNYYKDVIGSYPEIYVNHMINKDNIYWGEYRLTFPVLRWMYLLFKPSNSFTGHIDNSPYFWSDIAEKIDIKYSRDFSFYELNLAKIGSVYPRTVKEKPVVDKWFYTSDGHDVNAFNDLLTPQNLDEIESNHGYSIIYTHFGKGFYRGGRLDPLFVQRINDLVQRDVWITTTGNLLQFLEEQNLNEENTMLDEYRLQLRWSIEQILHN